MKSIDLIRWALDFTAQGTARLVSDLRNTPLTPCTPGGKGGDGNHPIWLLGHLAFIEGAVHHTVTGAPNPVERWAPLFAPGTQPRKDAAAYPTFDELLRTFQDLRARNVALLDQLGESGLDRPPADVPKGFEEIMTTAGQTLLLTSIHNMVHYGQIADCRRVAGIKPPM